MISGEGVGPFLDDLRSIPAARLPWLLRGMIRQVALDYRRFCEENPGAGNWPLFQRIAAPSTSAAELAAIPEVEVMGLRPDPDDPDLLMRECTILALQLITWLWRNDPESALRGGAEYCDTIAAWNAMLIAAETAQ